MRQPPLPFIAALLASAVGLLIGDSHRTLTLALPTAFVLLALLKAFIDTETVPPLFKTIFLTVLLWLPVCALFLYLLVPFRGVSDCVIDINFEDAPGTQPTREEVRLVFAAPGETASPYYPCAHWWEVRPAAMISAGLLNRKALSKPTPHYPPIGTSVRAKGTVVVAVVVDAASGEVVQAWAVSGHPLLRQAAREAACRARFAPTVCGPALSVSGVLTYDF